MCDSIFVTARSYLRLINDVIIRPYICVRVITNTNTLLAVRKPIFGRPYMQGASVQHMKYNNFFTQTFPVQ